MSEMDKLNLFGHAVGHAVDRVVDHCDPLEV